MKNVDAYNIEGYSIWLEGYIAYLSDSLKNDTKVSLSTFKKNTYGLDYKEMKEEGLSEEEIMDYSRLYDRWAKGALDGAYLMGIEGHRIMNEEFNLIQNDTHRENLDALRFMCYLEEKRIKTVNVGPRK